MRVEDAEAPESDWAEILRNERINRELSSLFLIPQPHSSNFMGTGKIIPHHLSNIMEAMTDKNLAIYEPPKQTRSILIYWRLPEEWAEVLYEWVRAVLTVRGRPFFHCDFLGS